MRGIFYCILLIGTLQSCTSYYFTVPQPYGGEKLAELPENLRGTWNCRYDSLGEIECIDNEGLTITSSQILVKEKNETTIWKLGKDIEILKLNGYTVINLLETRDMVDMRGKLIASKLYMAFVVKESEGVISVWNLSKPWDKVSERKMRHGKLLSDPSSKDSSNVVTNVLLNFSLKESDLEKICSSKPIMMFLTDGLIISGDEIEWDDYECEGTMFENPSDNRKYAKWSEKISRLQRKQDILIYQKEYSQVFGEAPKGYTLVMTEEFYTDSSAVKHPLNFSENPKKYEVYRLVEYFKDIAPQQQDFLHIDRSRTIPNEIAQEYIEMNKISFITFKQNDKPYEQGVTTWRHLSEEDKENLMDMIGYRSLFE